MTVALSTLERIYPLLLDPSKAGDEATLRIHCERYSFAARQLRGVHILDMACGCGYGTALLAQHNPDKSIMGVDIDPNAVAYAKAHYRLPNLSFHCADAQSFRAQQPFDSIVSLETIEHLPRPQALIEHLGTLLAPAGCVIASVPITPTLDGNPHHLHDFTRHSFFHLFQSLGLAPILQFEQIQWWQFKGLFAQPASSAQRSAGVGSAVLRYYRDHPSYLVARVLALLRYGCSNRYLTCVFAAS